MNLPRNQICICAACPECLAAADASNIDSDLALVDGVGLAIARRRILQLAGLAVAGLVLTACGSNTAARAGSSGITISNGPGVYTGPNQTPKYVPPTRGGSVSILPRSAWTRAGLARPKDAYPMGSVSRITVHHSGTDGSGLRTQSDSARHVESIRQSHVRNGWADIGYHYVIDPQGRVYAARPANRQGAHVKDQNENNLGIMLIGNFNREKPSGAAIGSLNTLLAMQMRQYRVPIGRVYTHKELKSTECPGSNLQAQMTRMRTRGGGLA